MMLEVEFAEWIAKNHWRCHNEVDFILYWESESKGMSHVSTDLLFDIFLDELSK
jgi:hypothetical protein